MARHDEPATKKASKKAPAKKAAESETPETPEPTDTKAPEETPKSNGDKPDNKAIFAEFQTVAQKVVGDRDEATGLTEEQIAPVVEVFRKLDGAKFYNKAREWVMDQVTDAVMPPTEDMKLAKAWVKIKDSLKAATPPRAKKPADPTEQYIHQRYMLGLAANLIEDNLPDGLAEDWEEQFNKFDEDHAGQVETYQAWLADESDDKGGEPEVDKVVGDAFKLATKKIKRSGGGGKRRPSDAAKRSTFNHIQQVFASLPVGKQLTVAEIANADSEEYGDDHPSPGAINQRLFKEGDKKPELPEGIEAIDSKPRSAKKVAEPASQAG